MIPIYFSFLSFIRIEINHNQLSFITFIKINCQLSVVLNTARIERVSGHFWHEDEDSADV